jgi:hypothetical protein
MKWTKEKELYGELINIEDKPTFMNRLIENWNREYSKVLQVFDLKKDDLGKTFNWPHHWIKGKNKIRSFKIIGQFEQELLLVQRTDTKRYYRMPTKEVAEAFKMNLEPDFVYDSSMDI